LIVNKLVENSPASIAEFLKNTSKLDKVRMLLFLEQLHPCQNIIGFDSALNFAGYDW